MPRCSSYLERQVDALLVDELAEAQRDEPPQPKGRLLVAIESLAAALAATGGVAAGGVGGAAEARGAAEGEAVQPEKSVGLAASGLGPELINRS